MRFIPYYNIVNDYIKSFIIVWEKLSPCPRAQSRGIAKNLIKILFCGLRSSLYCLGYLVQCIRLTRLDSWPLPRWSAWIPPGILFKFIYLILITSWININDWCVLLCNPQKIDSTSASSYLKILSSRFLNSLVKLRRSRILNDLSSPMIHGS